jgi:hypothetical protein
MGDPATAGANILGTVLQAGAQLEAGDAARQQAAYQASQMRRNALAEQAVGSVAVGDEVRKMELMQSRILAVAGASGAGAVDPTVVNLISQTESEGRLAAATRIYNSDVAAQSMREQASATDYEGQLAYRASRFKALGTVLSQGKSIMDTYQSSNKPAVGAPSPAPVSNYSLSSGGSSFGLQPGGLSLKGY